MDCVLFESGYGTLDLTVPVKEVLSPEIVGMFVVRDVSPVDRIGVGLLFRDEPVLPRAEKVELGKEDDKEVKFPGNIDDGGMVEMLVPDPVDVPVRPAHELEFETGNDVVKGEVGFEADPISEVTIGSPEIPVDNPPLARDDGDTVELSVGYGGDEAFAVPLSDNDDKAPVPDEGITVVVPGAEMFLDCEVIAD